ncbi:MAG: hypothetical protein Q4B45_06075 [Coriobacteriia bacterium]|nr:hypothetical protein [Coriobacteriia bacterium]
MLMSDAKIKGLIDSGALVDAVETNIGPVSYDLRTKCFYANGAELSEVELSPGDSVFVGSVESVHLQNDVAARVLLKNSRIRQGLSLDAPLYFPGHSTRFFFRVTNVSANVIRLDTSKGIGQAAFESVEGVEHPYSGAFSDEFSFSGLASYEGAYADQVKELEKKKDEIKGVETRIYGNVMTLFALFAAIFTFVNVNAGALSGTESITWVVVVDLMVLGGFTLLAGLMDAIVSSHRGSKIKWWIITIGLVAIAVSIIIAL